MIADDLLPVSHHVLQFLLTFLHAFSEDELCVLSWVAFSLQLQRKQEQQCVDITYEASHIRRRKEVEQKVEF